ncbi:hypothetical protein GCM10028784_21930 [Myceligenerans cantabricum]
MTSPGTITVAVLLLLTAGAVALAGALPWTHALAGALVVAVLVGVHRSNATPVDDPTWPRRAEEPHAGGRHEVSDLGWSLLDGDGHVKDHVTRRVRTLAARRLHRTGHDTRDLPAALADRLGTDLGPRPTTRTLTSWLDAIDRLPDDKDPRP